MCIVPTCALCHYVHCANMCILPICALCQHVHCANNKNESDDLVHEGGRKEFLLHLFLQNNFLCKRSELRLRTSKHTAVALSGDNTFKQLRNAEPVGAAAGCDPFAELVTRWIAIIQTPPPALTHARTHTHTVCSQLCHLVSPGKFSSDATLIFLLLGVKNICHC
jgi:hypothetical protein